MLCWRTTRSNVAFLPHFVCIYYSICCEPSQSSERIEKSILFSPLRSKCEYWRPCIGMLKFVQFNKISLSKVAVLKKICFPFFLSRASSTILFDINHALKSLFTWRRKEHQWVFFVSSEFWHEAGKNNIMQSIWWVTRGNETTLQRPCAPCSSLLALVSENRLWCMENISNLKQERR